jgi:hypothetical protein
MKLLCTYLRRRSIYDRAFSKLDIKSNYLPGIVHKRWCRNSESKWGFMVMQDTMDPEDMEVETSRKYKLLLICRSTNATSRVSERESRTRQHHGRSSRQYPLNRRFAVSIVVKCGGEIIVYDSEGNKFMGILCVVPSESRRSYMCRGQKPTLQGWCDLRLRLIMD